MNLRNSQYQTIMRRYDLIQQEHRHELDMRYQEIIDRIPEYRDCDQEIAALCAKSARAAILRSASADSIQAADVPLNESLRHIKSRQHRLLIDAGYAPDYLELTYTCPDCLDSGYIGDKKCHCFKQAIVDLLYSQSGIHDRLQTENFDSFDMSCYSTKKDSRLGISPRENMQKILGVCSDFIKNFDDSSDNLLFYGDTGVGKTFLANCIAKELLDSSHTVIYLTAFGLVDILASNTFGSGDDDDGEQMFDYILDCDLLIIDDLGTELNNSFVTSQLFLCLNERLTAGRSTIISTNLSLDQLQQEYSERIFSRLISHYDVMLIIGEDIRIKKAIS